MDVIICDDGNLGIQAKNTYDSIKRCLGDKFWFVLLPKTAEDSEDIASWASDERHILEVRPDSIGGITGRNKVYDFFPKAEWVTRIAPGTIITTEYFNYLNLHRKDPTVGAVGAIGYFIHGNWEDIDGNEVPPRHLAHVLKDVLWSWKVDDYRYDEPFNNIYGGHYDHQLTMHEKGLNCLTAPATAVRVYPEETGYDETLEEAVKILSDRWAKRLDFLRTNEIAKI
jgi:hypothetical protein